MSVTVNDIIKQSLKAIAVLDPKESPSPSITTDGLNMVNDILEEWTISKVLSNALTQESFSLVAGQASYTIGVGGNFNTSRPVNITQAYITDSNNNDSPMQIITYDQYNDISDKTTQSDNPYYLYYSPSYPLGTIYLYSTPSSADTIHLTSWKNFGSYATINTVVSLPPGYKKYLIYKLAIEWCPHFGKQLPIDVLRTYEQIKKTVEDLNRKNNIPGFNSDLTSGKFNSDRSWMFQ
jgi:hypothetical protein